MHDFALYIHYPFCLQRCYYCGFTTNVIDKAMAVRYHEALLTELNLRAEEQTWQDGKLRSIYFGGGTPALMTIDFLTRFLNRIRDCFVYPPNIEVTIETNPGINNSEILQAFHETGINRLSIGAQSFHDDELQLLGRIHRVDDIVRTVKIGRETGFDNISLDLIYGIPGQSVSSFVGSVSAVIDLGIKHLSAYILTIEKGTRFDHMIENGALMEPDSDLAADQYQELCRIMGKAGFKHYELTNFARKDRESRHNQTYWKRMPYLGLGTGAHTFYGNSRCWNLRKTIDYIDRLNSCKIPQEGRELLSLNEELEEQIYLSLRTSDGLDPELAQKASDSHILENLIIKGFMIIRNGRFRVPEEHWLLLDEIVLKLLSKCDGNSP